VWEGHDATRIELNNEWHARPSLQLPAPFRCTHVVELRREATLTRSRDEFAALCAEFGQAGPPQGARHHTAEIGSCWIKWELHTEATSHTIFVPGTGQPPFGESAIDFLSQPVRERLIDGMFLGVQVEVLRSTDPDDPHGYRLAQSLLGSKTVYGGWMSARAFAVWSAFKLDSRGFLRLVVIELEDHEERLSRVLHRLLDLETYRMLAMLGLPRAREVMATLGELEPRLDEVMAGLLDEGGGLSQEESLKRITGIAAKVEHIAFAHAYRFAASRAYASLVERRCREVEEEVLDDHQRYTNFLLRSLQPAMRTCEAAERRNRDLAERVGRATSLLDTMVDVVQKKQNQSILESMARSSRLQIQLQQAVEGFSIVAISYYGVGLLAYGLKAAKVAGLPVDPDLLAGLAAPAVLAAVWLTVRFVRSKLALPHPGSGDEVGR